VIAASLRQDPPVLSIEDGAKLWNFWPSLWKRSGRLKYNAKVDKYRGAEIDLQAIWQHLKREHPKSIGNHKEPLKTEIVTIKPKWLCGTFAFHPMLGFRRKRQAESIAHGCATTLLQMQRLADERKEPVLKSWGMGLSDRDEAALRYLPRTKKAWRKASRKDGKCWLRPDTTCPFSDGALKGAFEPDFADVVSEIYTVCQRPKTHAATPRFRNPKPSDPSTA
jgi:hypothetical protein